MRTWKVLDFGDVPHDSVPGTPFTCTECGEEALLPMVGVPIAQVGDGLVFDFGPRATPRSIECPHCGRQLEKES